MNSINLDSSSQNLTLSGIIKGVSIVLLSVISILLGLLPQKMKNFQQNQALLGYINSFAAGLFLGMGLLDLLGGSLHDYDEYMDIVAGTDEFYPFPILVSIASFALILLLDKVLFSQHELLHTAIEEEQEPRKEEIKELPSPIQDIREITKHMSEPVRLVATRDFSHVCDPDIEEANFKKLLDLKEKLARKTFGIKLKSLQQIKKVPSVAQPSIEKQQSEGLIKLIDHGEAKEAEAAPQEQILPHVTGPLTILVALSIHGICEGIAVGIQKAPIEVLNIVIAVLLHKWAEALTLGIALHQAKIPKNVIIVQVIIFSLAGPLGIVIGWLLSNSSLLISAIFKAIPAGTFIYIAATELVVAEFSVSRLVFRKYLCFLAGIILMGLILLIGS